MATRLDHDCAVAAATAVVNMVQHVLREDELRDFHGMVQAALKACLAKRDELLARKRHRLARPSDN